MVHLNKKYLPINTKALQYQTLTNALLHGQNSNQLFNQMCQLAENINQTNITNKINQMRIH